MPIQRCQIDGVDGWKFGPQGKCYTGPKAKEKAIKQGIAIGEANKLEKLQRIAELAKTKVSFDYDGTLTTSKIQDIVKNLTTAGATEIYIISARHDKASMYSLATKLGIPQYRVFATGSNKAKVEKIKELGIKTHYDNSQEVKDMLPNIVKLI